MDYKTLIDRESALWLYLQPELQELLNDGEILVDFADKQGKILGICDYSFLVFPFSKAYEGFLKKLFLDLGVIHYDDYYGDDLRIGRVLNPHFQHEKTNVFSKMVTHSNERGALGEKLWAAWKTGRNLVFHYFPHNYKRLDYDEAFMIVKEVIDAMTAAVVACNLPKKEINTLV